MAENGDVEVKAEPMEQQGDNSAETMETEEKTEDYQKLVDYGISEKVANELDNIYKSGECLLRTLFKIARILLGAVNKGLLRVLRFQVVPHVDVFV